MPRIIDLPEDCSQDFTFPCVICGAGVTVIGSEQQPHHCRIDLDSQRDA